MSETYEIIHHEVQGHPEGVVLMLDCRTGREKPGDSLPTLSFSIPWEQAREIAKALHLFDLEAKQLAEKG